MVMGSFRMFLILITIIFFIALPVQAKDMILKEPPQSLSKYYPPENKEPQWIQQMQKMSTHFGGVFVNLKEKDFQNVDIHADKLVEEYKKTSEMVPEWEDYFDIKAAEAFAEAAKTHDIAKTGKVSGRIGKTCGKCHAEQEVAVWTKFHWPSFHKIKIIDPISEKEMRFDDYMSNISSSFKGVTINFGEGQYDRSAKALKNFTSQYMELKSTCSKCHTNDDVKIFYVGKETEGAFSRLVKELNAESPNLEKFWKDIRLLGRVGCKQCHLTHRTYSFIQEVWNQK
jgi:hypothetical protein